MLHEGELDGDCIACPLHGTRFRLADGAIERGPSAYPQPVYEARVNDGRVEIRSPA
jgi:nitrite reductase/ring-hydroxylating ferredoxin subunit